jgi:hypothetical protein
MQVCLMVEQPKHHKALKAMLFILSVFRLDSTRDICYNETPKNIDG